MKSWMYRWIDFSLPGVHSFSESNHLDRGQRLKSSFT